jgi:DNA-binding NarL/FixJ family response regulator
MPGPAEILLLIVDDNDLVGQSLARCCQVPDIVLLAVASTAAAALEAGCKYEPDVVLMDYQLGSHGGVDVARELINAVPSSKVIILTGAVTERMKLEAHEAGCVGCLDKTISVGRMLPALIRRVHSGGPV